MECKVVQVGLSVISITVLMEPKWNVKDSKEFTNAVSGISINGTKVECKGITPNSSSVP